MANDSEKVSQEELLLLSTKLDMLTSESANKNSSRLDELTSEEIARLMNQEDKAVGLAVEKALRPIGLAIEAAKDALLKGGRIIYVGAGTSGRLGILDASEIPPTFSAPNEMFQAIMAGGVSAMFQAKEGVEDSELLGENDLQEAQVCKDDLVIGLAASGRTPYVLSALGYANELGAMTVGITCNAETPLEQVAQIPIAVVVGPEVLAGSTRLKSGTAQKMVLNMISTGAMVRIGKCYGNRMVDLSVTNEKLKARAINLVEELAGVKKSRALETLLEADWDVKVAIVMCGADVSAQQSKVLLAKTNGHLRQALQEIG